jgi:hypothetical protein
MSWLKKYESEDADYDNVEMANGGLIKRADGSYSKRGLWDNIRANKGSGKKPTAEMLKQERKIKAQEKAYGGWLNQYDEGGPIEPEPPIFGGTLRPIEVTPYTQNYPQYSKLTPEERKLFNDKSPIGRSIQSKAKHGSTYDVNNLKNVIVNSVTFPVAGGLQGLQIPQALMIEGIEHARGNPYNYSNVIPRGFIYNKQRAPSDTFLKDTGLIPELAGDIILDPLNIVGAGYIKNAYKTLSGPLSKNTLKVFGKNVSEIPESVANGIKGAKRADNVYDVATSKLYNQNQTLPQSVSSSVDDVGRNNVVQNGFIDTKGVLQKYPKGALTQKEINLFKNSESFKKAVQEHSEYIKQYGDNWKLDNYMETALANQDRNIINPILYGGNNWKPYQYGIAATAATAYPLVAGLYGLAESPPAVKSKVLKSAGVIDPTDFGFLSDRDTVINLNDNVLDYAKVNESKEGKIILGGEFIESTNNSVRKAKDWLSASDTYSDKKYSSKDIESFYGVENGKFKVGKATEFSPDTEIVPRRFGAKKIKEAVLNGKEMRLLDNENNPIYQNTPNTGKFILYSPSSKKSEFIYINKGESGVKKVNDFIKKNKDAEYIHLDNGRYEYYGINPEGLTTQDFKSYYQQDLERKGNPGYNIIIKKEMGGWLNKYN